MPRVRLDALLSERGLFPSRTRAAASVLAGEVMLGPGRTRASKPGQMVDEDVVVGVRAAPAFVSRGGVKLSNALDAFGVAVTDRSCLDVGASTGGFTDCLLKRGAARVIALDVSYGQLDWGLRQDPRVTVIERSNARALGPSATAVRAVAGGDRRLVHLDREGPAGGPGLAWRRCMTAWR